MIPCRHLARFYDSLPDTSIVGLAQAGDLRACEYLLYKYRTLVSSKTHPFYLAGGERDDILQIGMIGLWQSILDYSPAKQISFISFARLCIERHVISAIKTSTRQKQQPLNNAVSIEFFTHESESDFSLTDVLISSVDLDPEEVLLRKEDQRMSRAYLRELLSKFEWEVLNIYGQDKSYYEIALCLKCSTKSVDNALSRIKRKISTSFPAVASCH
jgi:RNA polymerase sporulation-specific sigma factor